MIYTIRMKETADILVSVEDSTIMKISLLVGGSVHKEISVEEFLDRVGANNSSIIAGTTTCCCYFTEDCIHFREA